MVETQENKVTRKSDICSWKVLKDEKIRLLVRIQYLGTLELVCKGSCKKALLLMARPLRGGGVKGRAIKEKNFFYNLFSNVPKFQRPLSSKKNFFCGFPKSNAIVRGEKDKTHI